MLLIYRSVDALQGLGPAPLVTRLRSEAAFADVEQGVGRILLRMWPIAVVNPPSAGAGTPPENTQRGIRLAMAAQGAVLPTKSLTRRPWSPAKRPTHCTFQHAFHSTLWSFSLFAFQADCLPGMPPAAEEAPKVEEICLCLAITF